MVFVTMAGSHAAGAHVSHEPQLVAAQQELVAQLVEQADASHGAEPHDEEQLLEHKPAKADCAVMARTAIARNRFFRIRCILQNIRRR